MKKDRLVYMPVSPEFKKKITYEARIVRGVSVAEYTRMIANSDKDIKSLINKDVKLESKKIRRGFDFGI